MKFIEALKYLTDDFSVHSDTGIVILSLPASVPLEYLTASWNVAPETVYIVNGNYYHNYNDALRAANGKNIYSVTGTPRIVDPNTTGPFGIAPDLEYEPDTEDDDSIDASATQARDENIIWGE